MIKNSLCLVKIAIVITAAYLWATPTGPIGERRSDISARKHKTSGGSSLHQADIENDVDTLSFSLPENPSLELIDSVFRQAIVAYGDSKWEKALQYFDTLAVRPEARAWYSRSHLMGALCCVKLEKYPQAAVFIKKAMPGFKTISDHLRIILAEIRMSQKDYPKALYSFENILKEYPQSNLYSEALLGALQCRLHNDDAQYVLKTIDSLEKEPLEQDYRFSGINKDLQRLKTGAFKKMRCFKREAAILSERLLDGSAIGMHAQCRSRLKQLAQRGIRHEPSSRHAFKSYILQLRNIQAYPEIIRLTETRRQKENVDPGSKFDHWLYFNRAFSFYRMQQYDRGEKLFQKISNETKDRKLLQRCWWYIARCRLRAGKSTEAIMAFRYIIESFDNSTYARRAPHEIVWIYCHKQNYDRALKTIDRYRDIYARYPGSRWTMRWMEAWMYYLKSDHEKALTLFDTLKNTRTYRTTAQYWKARCLHKLGRNSEARSIYEKLAENDFFTWHRLAASQQLIALESDIPQFEDSVDINFRRGKSTPKISSCLPNHTVSTHDTIRPIMAGSALSESTTTTIAQGILTDTVSSAQYEIDETLQDSLEEKCWKDFVFRSDSISGIYDPTCFNEGIMMKGHSNQEPGYERLMKLLKRLEKDTGGIIENFPSLQKAIVWIRFNERNRAAFELKSFIRHCAMLDTLTIDSSSSPAESTAVLQKIPAHDTNQKNRTMVSGKVNSSSTPPVTAIERDKEKQHRRDKILDSLERRGLLLRQKTAVAWITPPRARIFTDLLTELNCHYTAYVFFVKHLMNAPESIVSTEYRRRIFYPLAYYKEIRQVADSIGIPFEIALAVMRTESRFNAEAVSPVGATGLMQIMPLTAERIACCCSDTSPHRCDLYNPHTNIRYGIWYLKQLLDKFDGNIPLAVASYNGGPFNVEQWVAHSDSMTWDEVLGCMKFGQTRHYTRKVLLTIAVYRWLYADRFTSWNIARKAQICIREGITW
ncbi:MAG: transglycosylase SLT domain-containing protein [Chitinivibrionales bacterium]|nr:transglycosylase SLT domain-containing protein [Chitinivibrionales bacterium]